MHIQAYQKYVREAPRKLRLVADFVNHWPVEKALTHLKLVNKRAAKTIVKVLTQAKANAIASKLNQSALTIKSIEIEVGPTLKRFRPVSRGRAHAIAKRVSHIKIIVEDQEKTMTSAPKITMKGNQ